MHGTLCMGNGGSGLTFFTSFPAGDTTIPLAAHASFVGNVLDGNGTNGLYLDGRNIVASANICRRNGREGIRVYPSSIDVSLDGNIVVANGQEAAGTYSGILIEGRRVSLRGGNVIGVDADDVKVEADYAALTKYHHRNVLIAATARDVLVTDVMESYSVTTVGIVSLQINASDGCVIRQRGTTPPTSGSGIYGGIGSQYVRISAAGSPALWRKTSGTPNQSTTGWVREFASVLANQTVGVTQTTVAHGLAYTPTEISIVPRADARVWRSAAPDATNLYLTASVSVACDISVR